MKNYLYLFFICMLMATIGCSKKIHPSTTVTTVSNMDTTNTTKIVKRKAAEPIPKVISVSDAGAHKTVDGRYYYDLQGHRYWRNNKDRKYYLFNKSMYDNDDFKLSGN